MTTPETMHPFVALMRRYVVDYTNSHDQSIYPEIFTDDYRVHISGVTLVRDESYGPATAELFAAAPGLGLVVHELVLNGDRLCMRFSEHAAMPRAGGGRALSCWRGIGLYRWDGTRLTENHVEQDFLSRRRQIKTGRPDPLEAPHLDPWMTTSPSPAQPEVEAVARGLLERDQLHEARFVQIDDCVGEGARLVIQPEQVTVNDVFSAGRRVAVHATVAGPYRGGIDQLPADVVGHHAELQVAALVRVGADRSVESVQAVTSREQVLTALRPPR